MFYVVEAGKVVLIDDNTGRKLPGRRISEGVHQALECKRESSDPTGNSNTRLNHLPKLLGCLTLFQV